jgi:hypothetical protein
MNGPKIYSKFYLHLDDSVFIPSNEEEEKHRDEIKTLNFFKKNLNSDYVIFHSVLWKTKKLREGEIDFVILNTKSRRVLLIEQKNVKKENVKEENINYRIVRSKDEVKKFLKHKAEVSYKDNFYKHIEYFLFLPLVKVSDKLGIKKNINCFHENNSLIKEIQRFFNDFKKENNDWIDFDTLCDVFKDELNFNIDTQAKIKLGEEYFCSLNKLFLKDIISNIEMNPFRLKVNATAGSGKSSLAFWLYKENFEKGKNPLLICFNRELCNYFNKKMKEENIPEDKRNCYTFHDFCKKKIELITGKEFIISSNKSESFNKLISDLIKETNKKNKDFIEYGFLIIDEGQDFEKNWFSLVTNFVKGKQKKSSLVWLEDPQQRIKPIKEVPSIKDSVIYNHRYSYRVPKRITRFINALFKELDCENFTSFQTKVSEEGDVFIHEYSKEEEQLTLSGDIISSLLNEGFHKKNINIITLKSYDKSLFSTCEKVGVFSIKRLLKENNKNVWDKSKQDYKKTKGKIGFDSIGRYKGLEREVIILTDITEPELKNDCSEEEKIKRHKRFLRKLLCGLTRAKSRIYLLLDSNSKISKTISEVYKELNKKPNI